MKGIDEILKCEACRLSTTRRNLVLGRGRLNADLLYIGEGPGKTEDLRGAAFIGAAGKLLDKMNEDARTLDASDLPDLNKYYTNIVLCHPTDSFAGDNRIPRKDEVFACMENVLSIIRITSPRAIILVGNTAFEFYKRELPMAHHIQHPAYLLRKGGRGSPLYLRNVRILHEIMRGVHNEKSNISDCA